LAIKWFSFRMIGSGVPDAAQTPRNANETIGTPASFSVGTPGNAGSRFWPVAASTLIRLASYGCTALMGGTM
jgi:hypothetical protein